jgi:hypothetical protein
MKRHPFDALSFVSGAIVLAIGALILAGDSADTLSAWLAPAGIIGLGALLLLIGWQSSRSADPDVSADEA